MIIKRQEGKVEEAVSFSAHTPLLSANFLLYEQLWQKVKLQTAG